MKLILVSLVALFSLPAFAADLAAINCLAGNGVTIKGESLRGEELRVETHWGFFRKDFIATIGTGPDTTTTYVNLSTENGVQYALALNAKTSRRLTQKSTGSILSVSSVRGVQPAFVAFVACDVRFR